MHLKHIGHLCISIVISFVVFLSGPVQVEADEVSKAEGELIKTLIIQSYEVFDKPMKFELNQSVYEEPESKALLLKDARSNFPSPSLLRDVKFKTISTGLDFAYTEYGVTYPDTIDDPRAGVKYTIFMRWDEGVSKRYQEDGKKDVLKSRMVISADKPVEMTIGYTPK